MYRVTVASDHTQWHTHTHTHSVGLPWTKDWPIARTSTYTTQQSQESNVHTFVEIRTLNPSKLAAAGPLLRRLCYPKANFSVKPMLSLRQIYIRGATLHKTLFWSSTRRRQHKSNSHKTSSFTIPLITTQQQKGEGINLSNPSKFLLYTQHHDIQSSLSALCEIPNRRRLTTAWDLRTRMYIELNDDFHVSQHQLCRHGRCLLMWKVVQAWDLHRPTFCPL
jgi:hypothetical protein